MQLFVLNGMKDSSMSDEQIEKAKELVANLRDLSCRDGCGGECLGSCPWSIGENAADFLEELIKNEQG